LKINFQENPVISNVVQMLLDQQEKGLKKYGTLVNVEDYNLIGWIEHLQQELCDALIYLECVKQRFKPSE